MDCCGVHEVGTKTSIENSDPILAEEWRQSSQRRNVVNTEIHKTAKDRWSLVRLISRIGISVKHRNANDGSWSTDQDAYVVSSFIFHILYYLYHHNIFKLLSSLFKPIGAKFPVLSKLIFVPEIIHIFQIININTIN